MPLTTATHVDARDAARADARAAWEGFLFRELGSPVRVVWTRARRMPIQIRPMSMGSGGPSGRELRMHGIFAAAPADVRDAVARWARSGNRAARACARLDTWVAAELARVPPPEVPEERLVPRGSCHDLADLLRGLLAGEMRDDDALRRRTPRVTWGRPGRSRTRHSLRLGSFDNEGGIARIHPVLDQPAVPAWFVRYVLFHELLHGVFPPVHARGRWVHHGRDFRRRERAYADYARALAWEERHIEALVRSARRGIPLPVRTRPAAGAVRFLQRVLFPD